MLIANGRSFFDALLKLGTGQILATGTATVNVPGCYVTFKSDFVPLYPLGTPMEIVRIHHNHEIHRFTGKVYLSAKKLMRIVAVQDELLPGSELFYCDKMAFPAVLTACDLPSEAAKSPAFPRLLAKAPKEPEPISVFNVLLTEITDQKLVFQCDTPAPLAVGTRLCIRTAAPISLSGETVVIAQQFLFGHPVSYVCSYCTLSAEKRRTLLDFLWDYNSKRSKLF